MALSRGIGNDWSLSGDTDDGTIQDAAGMGDNSTGGGSLMLASGGDPVSASITADPDTTEADVKTAKRLADSAVKSGDSQMVISNIETVLGGENDPTNEQNDGGDDPAPTTTPEYPPDVNPIWVGVLVGLAVWLAVMLFTVF